MRRKSCIQIISEAYPKFTAGEKNVADYVIANIQETMYSSISELSKRVKVSVATIIRFCQSLGFEGYKEFKINLASEHTHYDDYILELKNVGNDYNDYIEGIKKVIDSELQSIKSTIEKLDFSKVKDVTRLIANSRNIMFFGVGTSFLICNDACIKFSRLNLSVQAFSDIHLAAVKLNYFNADDLLIGISHSGNTEETCKMMKIAKINNAKTVAIISFPTEIISEYSDIILQTVTRESSNHKVSISSRISQCIIIDVLFTSTVLLNYPEYSEKLINVSDKLIDIRKHR